MVFCTYCGHSFTRDEHLERHILTHTNIKPFKCLTCHMSFARRDLLQRHYTVHGKNQENQDGIPSIMIPKTAGRTPIACTNCAKTKTKCDKKFPCSRCTSRNLKCVLRPTRRVPRNPVNRPPMKAEGDGNTSLQSSDSPSNGIVTPDDSKGNSPQPQTQSQSEQAMSFIPQSQSPSHQNRTPEPRQSVSSEPSISFFGAPSSGAQGSSMSTILSPLPTPASMVNGFISATPMSGYEEFAASSRAGSDESSPRFIMDWPNLQFSPPPMDPLVRPDMIMAGGMNSTMAMAMDTMTDPSVLSMLPDFGQPLGALQTPLTTPRMSMSTTLSELEISTSGGALGVHTRHTSYSEPSPSSGDLPAVIKAQDGWNCFRSSPVLSPDMCPKTAKLHLQRLELSLKNHEGWNSWRLAWQDTDTNNDHLDVVPLADCSKDKLLAITQTFLHRALENHKNTNPETPEGGTSPMHTSSNFILLPSIRVLTYFLRSYVNNFERYFPMTSRGTLNLNELLMDPHVSDRASSLLTLLMIAAGSLYVPSIDARWLNGGLTEACRISLFNSVETNISMASDHTLLHSALLFISTAAWSGDKWHMNIAMGQRGMYTSMLRHSGGLEVQPSMPSPQLSPQELWRDWLQNESKSRLVYSWVMLDQDLSFFHDCNPMFTVTELGAPMPDSDRLWHAKSSSEWSTIFSQVHDFAGLSSIGTGVRPLSLRDMFRHFMEDNIRARGMQLTPLHLRLLLHPLQSMVGQYCQLSGCLSDEISSPQSNPMHAASVRARFDEIRILLERWQVLSERYLASHPTCAIMQASLAMFHLISLNAAVSLPDIERVARRENLDVQYSQLVFLRKKCVSNSQEAIFHAGQVLRLMRTMPTNIRPAWWPGAIYRAGLVLWAESLIQKEFTPMGQPVAVDSLPPSHPVILQFRNRGEGIPSLAKKNGSQIRIDDGFSVLTHCIEILDEGIANRFSDGIRNKLERLATGG